MDELCTNLSSLETRHLGLLKISFLWFLLKEVQYDSEHFLQTSNIYFTEKKNIYDLLFEQQFLVPSVRSEIHKITFALAILS